MTEASTPLMRQYAAIKKQHPNALLFFRLGDFYELFFEDAVVAARELQITLTSRNKEKDQAIPMCGVPSHSPHGDLFQLLRQGVPPAGGYGNPPPWEGPRAAHWPFSLHRKDHTRNPPTPTHPIAAS